MARKGAPRTAVGVELVRRLNEAGDRIFTTERAREVAPRAGVSSGYLVEVLHHLAKSGWLVHLRKGLYAISSSVPGATPAHEYEIATALVRPAAISHWSALHHHGLTEQAPRRVFVLTTTGASVPRVRSRKPKTSRRGYTVNRTTYKFVQVRPERFFGIEKVWISEARVSITDAERTLLDGLGAPQHCGDFAEVLHAFEARGDDLDLDRIASYALKLDAATAKRLGWVLENQGRESPQLEGLASLPIKGYRKLDPSGPGKGPRNRRWMIQENLPGRISS